jgi:FMN reductase
MTISTIRVVGVGGSTDSSSTSRFALERALFGAEQAGATTTVLDLGSLDIPFYSDETEPTADVLRFAQAHRDADAVIWATPLYHGAPSGRFKNAIDWLELLHNDPRSYLADMPVGLIATAGGAQALQAINAMEDMVRALRGITVPLTAPIQRAWSVFNEDGSAKDEAVEKTLTGLGAEVVRLALRLKVPSS